MKKRLLIALVVGLALVPTAALAHTEGAPLVVDLLAGQTEDIGDVLVWNDADYLYVKFVSTGDCLLETHVSVGDALSDIPQTKNGNPIPGKFEYSDPHACVTDYTYQIDLAWSPDTPLYIAAHAALGRREAMAVLSGVASTTVTRRRAGNEPAFTPANTAAVGAWEPCNQYPNCDTNVDQEPSLWDNRILPKDVLSAGGDWIWESRLVQDTLYGTVITLQTPFNIDGYPMSGGLDITCDNGYEAFVNGTSAGSDNVIGVWRTSNLKQAFVDFDNWDSVEHYDISAYLQSGANTLTIDAANEYFNIGDSGNPWPGTQANNPAGCIFAAEISYLADGETAWGDGPGFPGKNWAMYFTYTVQRVCPSIVGMSENIELLASPPPDVNVGAYESDNYVRLWQEFLGPLAAPLEYDLEAGRIARDHGPNPVTLEIAAGEYVCSYYVHLDNEGSSSTVQKTGWVQFDTNVLGLIISGGDLGTFANRDLMFVADADIGYSGTDYPDTSGVNYWRGFDVNYGRNLDDAVFSGGRVDFTMWVVNAHDSFRIILPALWQ